LIIPSKSSFRSSFSGLQFLHEKLERKLDTNIYFLHKFKGEEEHCSSYRWNHCKIVASPEDKGNHIGSQKLSPSKLDSKYKRIKDSIFKKLEEVNKKVIKNEYGGNRAEVIYFDKTRAALDRVLYPKLYTPWFTFTLGFESFSTINDTKLIDRVFSFNILPDNNPAQMILPHKVMLKLALSNVFLPSRS